MHSDVRRPAAINIERFVASLDDRLRSEVSLTRRILIPIVVTRLLRALKIRSMAFLQAGALALTALAVIVAVGIGPVTNGARVIDVKGPLAAPTWHSDSFFIVKSNSSRVMELMGGRSVSLKIRGIYE